ncbi:MAG: hypothetical protein BWK78_06385 [Thiotrichaceae bacterium IS1]|nr:MAG: hypothetical protein BWK78_06385 [Thiotrichaceae bacterium IS1]
MQIFSGYDHQLVIRKFLQWGSLFFMLILLLGTPAWAQEVVGYIDNFNGPPSAFVLKRNGQEVKITLFTPLQTGDEISVRNVPESKENSINLLLGDNKPIVLKYADTKNGPYVVTSKAPLPSPFSNLLNTISDWFAQILEEQVIHSTITK